MTTLTESVTTRGRVDRTTQRIRGVHICGFVSKNGGRRYDRHALKRAIPMYEGAKVRIDHNRSGRDRSVFEDFGTLKNVRMAPDGLRGDIHYFANHRDCEFILERAENDQRSFGLSHNADGRVEQRSGKPVVVEIMAVRSVDIVSRPATTQGLFEDVNDREARHRLWLKVCNLDQPDRQPTAYAILESRGVKLSIFTRFALNGYLKNHWPAERKAKAIVGLLEEISVASLDAGGLPGDDEPEKHDCDRIEDCREKIREILDSNKPLSQKIHEIEILLALKTVAQAMDKESKKKSVAESYVWTGSPQKSIRSSLREWDAQSDYEKFKARFGSRR